MLSRILKGACINSVYAYKVPGPAGEEQVASVASGEPGESESLFASAQSEQEDDNRVTSSPGDSTPAAAGAADGINKEKVDFAVEQGYREGFAQGKAEAAAAAEGLLNEAARKLDEAGEKAADCLEQAWRKAREIVRASEADLIELSVAIAEKLIHDELSAAPQKVARIVRETLRNFTGKEEKLKVYLHPVDLAACQDILLEGIEDGGRGPALELVPDRSLPRGSCRIDSESSTAEYILSDELEKIRNKLLKIAPIKGHKKFQEEEQVHVREPLAAARQ